MTSYTAAFALAWATLLIADTTYAAEPVLTALPLPFETRHGPVAWTAKGADALTITAGPNANWFVSPWDLSVVDSAPTILVHPQGDFSLSAKLSLSPKKRWDSGCLALFLDGDHWAKLCLENANGDGKLSAVSVVNSFVSDDVYTDFFAPDNTLYLRVSRKGTALSLLASHEGSAWTMFRTFTFKGADLDQLRIGLLAQSPVGDGMTVDFSDIRYSATP